MKRDGYLFDKYTNWVRWVGMNFCVSFIVLTTKKISIQNKKVILRAIRTRTVDLLGKTEKTSFYRNDSNCFKDPTCILLHWALSSTDVKIS